ncbi:MAG: hypothetical protein ACRYFW_14965 [Janthinobacterium lividum]
MSIATVISPAATSGSLPSMSHLAGIGMLIAERDGDNRWLFDVRSHAIGAGDGEDALLVWATHAMLADGIVLGWRLADEVLPPLLDAAGQGDAEIGRAFLDRLATLVTGLSVDLAVPHGGAGAPAFGDIAAARGITGGTMTAAAIESVWSFGESTGVREHVEADALALWQLWLLEGNGRAAAASEAFTAWLGQRSNRIG